MLLYVGLGQSFHIQHYTNMHIIQLSQTDKRFRYQLLDNFGDKGGAGVFPVRCIEK